MCRPDSNALDTNALQGIAMGILAVNTFEDLLDGPLFVLFVSDDLRKWIVEDGKTLPFLLNS